MKALTRYKFFLWYFGRFKVPLIGCAKPQLLKIDSQEIMVKIPLTKRSKNHLNSLYFGALAIGADITGGLHGFYHAELAHVKISLLFKSFEAQFLRRPESDVYFCSKSGEDVKKMIAQSQQTGERTNHPIPIQAYVNFPKKPELIANFIIELSLKVIL